MARREGVGVGLNCTPVGTAREGVLRYVEDVFVFTLNNKPYLRGSVGL